LKTLAIAMLSVAAAGSLFSLPTRAVSQPPVLIMNTLSCSISPGGTTQSNGSCVTNTPAFNFDAMFVLNAAMPPSYQVEWSITPVLGAAPQIGSGCTAQSTFCDLALQSNSTTFTKVQVRADIYEMPGHTLVTSAQVTARAPCTTVKTGNHPTSC
jgi:hypothetical protein